MDIQELQNTIEDFMSDRGIKAIHWESRGIEYNLSNKKLETIKLNEVR